MEEEERGNHRELLEKLEQRKQNHVSPFHRVSAWTVSISHKIPINFYLGPSL